MSLETKRMFSIEVGKQVVIGTVSMSIISGLIKHETLLHAVVPLMMLI